MIPQFDFTTTASLFAPARSPIPTTEGNAPSCPVGACMGRPFVGLAFSRQKKASQATTRVFCAGKLQPRRRLGRLHAKSAENLSAYLFYDGKMSTGVSLDEFSPEMFVAFPYAQLSMSFLRKKKRGMESMEGWTVATSLGEGNISKVAVIILGNMYNMTHLMKGQKVAEVAGLAHNVCSLYDSCAIALDADIRLRNVMADLKDLSDRILDSLRNNRLINSLEVQDTHRNRCVSALVNLKKGYDKLSDETVQSHWTVLRPVFENFLTSIQEGNYQSKTALITAMLRRLSDADLASHLEGLADLKTAVDRLRDAQSTFDNAQLEYQLQLQKDKTPSATDLKEEIVEYINEKLVVHLEAKCNEDLATYAEFAKLLGSQIRAENAKVRRRRGKKETPSVIPATE